ncbi:hypothetical protein SGPA1_22097 [Streptomyces misionensis JCM 4497]
MPERPDRTPKGSRVTGASGARRSGRCRAVHHGAPRRRGAEHEVDWEQLRAVEKGRRSPLASLHPSPAPA